MHIPKIRETVLGPVVYVKKFGLYPEMNGKPLKCFKEGSDMRFAS